MSTLQWMPLLAAVLAGLSAALVSAMLARAIVDVPSEDRTYRDRPPVAFRLIWLPIHWLGYYLGPLLPVATRQRLLVKLRLAGLDYAFAPEQFVAAQILLGLGGAAFAWFVSGAWRISPMWPAVGLGLLGFIFPAVWLRDQVQLRRRTVLKTLPFFLDIITLCVEAGLNLTGALAHAVAKGPAGPLRDEFSRILRDVRAGKSRADALRTFADRMNEPAISNLVSSLIQAETIGMSLGPLLRAQAEQRRAERFARAEKQAMEAPVKMLFPLIAFIFPCTFLVLAFPIVMKFMRMGI